MKKLIQLEVSTGVVAKCINLDVFQEFTRKLVLCSKFKKMLNPVESFVVVEHEKIFALFFLGHIFESFERVISSKISRIGL